VGRRGVFLCCDFMLGFLGEGGVGAAIVGGKTAPVTQWTLVVGSTCTEDLEPTGEDDNGVQCGIGAGNGGCC
jgi:hypothetical protein